MNDRTLFRQGARAAFGFLFLAALSARVYGQGTVTTSDGLALSLSSSGSVSALKINGTSYGSSGMPSGFFYRESTTSMSNWVTNGSFESGSGSPASWTISSGTGTWSIDTGNHSAGSRSMKLSISGSSGERSPDLTSSTFPLNPNTPYILTCSFKASNAGGSGLTMYLLEQDQSGAWVQRQAPSPVGTHDWVTRTITFTSSPTSVQAYVKFYVSGGYGTNWVDDVKILDPFGGDTPVSFTGSVSSSGGVLTESGSHNGLSLTAHFTSVGSAIKVTATLTDTTGGERGVELAYRLPLDIVGWTWNDDFVTNEAIA